MHNKIFASISQTVAKLPAWLHKNNDQSGMYCIGIFENGIFKEVWNNDN